MFFKKQKKYYRLYELEKVCGIDHFDYLYFSEQYKDCINVYVHKLPVMITNDFWKDKIYCGTAQYSGLIRLTPNDKQTLLRNKKVTLSTFQLEEREDIKSYSNTPPFKIEKDNSIVNKWEHVELNELMETGVRAILTPQINSTNHDALKNINPSFDSISKKLSPRISMKTMDVVLQDICIPDYQAELIAILLNIDVKNEKPYAQNTELKGTTNDHLNLFQRYIIFLLKEFPTKGAANLWKMLRIEHEKDNDDIDPFCLLIAINSVELIWKNEKGVEKTIKKRSFETEVANVKKMSA
jgi:hypothetical protein